VEGNRNPPSMHCDAKSNDRTAARRPKCAGIAAACLKRVRGSPIKHVTPTVSVHALPRNLRTLLQRRFKLIGDGPEDGL
jgi:hypothetical protein